MFYAGIRFNEYSTVYFINAAPEFTYTSTLLFSTQFYQNRRLKLASDAASRVFWFC